MGLLDRAEKALQDKGLDAYWDELANKRPAEDSLPRPARRIGNGYNESATEHERPAAVPAVDTIMKGWTV